MTKIFSSIYNTNAQLIVNIIINSLVAIVTIILIYSWQKVYVGEATILDMQIAPKDESH